MLKIEERQTLIDYLTTSASDVVIVEAFENARRENSHVLITLVNYRNETRVKNVLVTAPLPTGAEPITPLIPANELPSKLTVIGNSCIETLRRRGQSASLAQIAGDHKWSVIQTKPQLALAVARGLVTQLASDKFEVKK